VKRSFAVVLWLCLAASDSGAANAAAVGFENFFAEFRSAIARNDSKAVANLTRLAVLFGGELRDHRGFQKIYPELFDAKVTACWKVPRRWGKAIGMW
jgi:hypothetical protein